MKAVSLRALSLTVALWLGMVGTGTSTGLLQAANPEPEELPAVIEAWIAYVYSGERERSWSAYVSVAARQRQQADALQKFGMSGAETAEQLAAFQEQAEARRLEQQSLMEAAYEAIAQHRDWKVSGEERALAAGGIDDASLKAALQKEEKAGRNARAAELLLKAGSMNALQYLAEQDAYVQARLQASATRETYVRAMIDAYHASSEQPIGLHDLLTALERAPEASLIEGWMRAAQRYAASAYGTIPGSGANAASMPAKTAGPDGKLVPLLPHTAVALMGGPVRLSAAAPPIQTASGQVYVALRPYAEAMHYRIEWDAKNDLLRLSRGAEKIELRIGKADATVDGQPYARNGHTYVPLAWLSDVTGSDMYWHEPLRQGIIIMRAIGDVE